MKLKNTYFESIEDAIQQINQWKELEHWHLVSEYTHKLESLVELGEIVLCGSVGGYDFKGKQREGESLTERAQHILKNKHRI